MTYRALSDRLAELSASITETAHDWLIQEACTRLDPDWLTRAEQLREDSDV